MPLMTQATPTNPHTALVLGGGLAGIAAAVRLAQRGCRVTLIETRKKLGGRATSFVDPTTKEVLDNCQHVLVGCCTSLMDLYRRLGVADKIEWHRKLYFWCPLDGEPGHSVVDVLDRDDLPAPFHMSAALMAFRSLSWPEKIAISRAMLVMMNMGKAGREKLHDISFQQWLEQQDQPRGAVEKFWSVVVISAINELPERMAAPYAIHVFQDAFMASERGYEMGLSAVPLVQLYDAAQAVIERAGGRVLLGRSVEKIGFADGRVTGVELDGGEFFPAELVVSALPFERLVKVCPPAMLEADRRIKPMEATTHSPIIGIHLWLAGAGAPDKRVMDLPHLVLMRGHVQWIFNKGWDEAIGGQHLHAVISAAHDLVDTPAEELAQMAANEARAALSACGGPAAARTLHAKLMHHKVVKEKRATFSASPGLEHLRPTAPSPITGFFLAGDWCKTGWPATMEGAVRSGYIAADAACTRYGLRERGDGPVLVEEMPASWAYRALSS
jgi:squalene-associated FAD-dependent desaturase